MNTWVKQLILVHCPLRNRCKIWFSKITYGNLFFVSKCHTCPRFWKVGGCSLKSITIGSRFCHMLPYFIWLEINTYFIILQRSHNLHLKLILKVVFTIWDIYLHKPGSIIEQKHVGHIFSCICCGGDILLKIKGQNLIDRAYIGVKLAVDNILMWVVVQLNVG